RRDPPGCEGRAGARRRGAGCAHARSAPRVARSVPAREARAAALRDPGARERLGASYGAFPRTNGPYAIARAGRDTLLFVRNPNYAAGAGSSLDGAADRDE